MTRWTGVERLMISFSGGRTSGYMTSRLLAELPPHVERVVLFANTGQEHEETLRFVDQCDRQLGFNTVWIEAVTNPERGKGVTPRVVDYATAARHGEPFEGAIKKHGIPNRNFPHCTRELKARPLRAFLRERGWKRFHTAIGIRADEFDRMSARADRDRILYPLVRWGVRKQDVLDWWRRQPFDLSIPEHLGNCVWCWKKSLRKHLLLARTEPWVFEFPARMEGLYPDAGPGERDRPRHFFRENRSAEDLLSFDDATPLPPFDVPDGCSESCEVHEVWDEEA